MVTVPDTIMRSAWRGDAHGTIPSRSTSNREANVAIISIAQQARPKVTGQTDDFLAQLKKAMSWRSGTSRSAFAKSIHDIIRAGSAANANSDSPPHA